jgi:1-phosphofructokinase family hexose kinase
MSKVFTLTLNPSLDRFITIPKMEPFKTIRGKLDHEDAGGKGLNVSRVLAKLRIESKLITILGGDIGKEVESILKKENLDCEIIQSVVESRVTNDFKELRGKEFKINEIGGFQSESTQQKVIESVNNYLGPDQIWLLGGTLPVGFDEDFYATLINIIQKEGSRVILDTSGIGLKKGIRANPFMIKPNIHETEQLLGIKINTVTRSKKAVKELLQKGVSIVIQSMGKAGAVYGCKSVVEHIKAPKVKVKNLVGAGDSSVAGIIYGLVNNMGISDIAKMAVATGSTFVECAKLDQLSLEKVLEKLK